MKIFKKPDNSKKEFYKDFVVFKEQVIKTKERFLLSESDFFPCLSDKQEVTLFDTHYIYHPAWAARIIKGYEPKEHIDISSTLHFCTILSAFTPVKFYDFRPANLILPGLTTGHADLSQLAFADNSVLSLSCMHTVEHIGLGRYGDPLDYDGDMKAINELKRVLAVDGNLLFVVPVGKPKIMFNAHRIYSFDMIMEYFSGLELKEFSLIPDDAMQKGMIINAGREHANMQKYGCGCFWFRK